MTASTTPVSGLLDPDSLTSVSRAPGLFAAYPHYELALQWVREFVTCPHPLLGRPGAVCPRLGPALDRDLVWLVTLSPSRHDVTAAEAAGPVLAELFENLFPGQRASQAALLALFPGLPANAAPAFIDGGHAALRLGFVERGLMLGEFHPASQVGSVHNRGLAVMRCPVPMFAVRALSPHDLLFLDRPETPPGLRCRYLEAFLAHLGPRLPEQIRARARTALENTTRSGLQDGGA
ncbi:DUF6875 domain-containing protein [Actinomadura harenae]|uniref:DUF6875 domain-containing protein n=1 Tax=Actinomadura harenae TaxID=2483351 RepID=A0A3M2LZS7_9ACTN|nr:hypothetical protein [Actinomadura harenae]RMI42093.1 hypothetical protein EBO15_20800 [Actinomadura harenae]